MMEEYGIVSEIKGVKPGSDISDEWRRMYPEVNPGTPDDEKHDNPQRPSNSNTVLMTYYRSPLRKSTLYGKNSPIHALTELVNADGEVTGLQINAVNYTEFTISVSLVTDNSLLLDTIELLLLNEVFEIPLKVTVNYKLGPNAIEVEGFEYNFEVQGINQFDGILNTNMRSINFEAKVTGAVFVPFYKSVPLLEEVDLEIWAFDKSIPPVIINKDKGDLAVTMKIPPAIN